MWNETFKQAGVEVSSVLRKAENVYYPPTIRASSSSGSKVETTSKDTDPSKDIPARALPSPNSPSKEVEQAGKVEKEKEITKEVALKANKPPTVPKDSSKKKVSQSQEIVLATFPIPTKEDSKGKGLTFSAAATAKPTKA